MRVKRLLQGVFWGVVALAAGLAFLTWAVQAFDGRVTCDDKRMRPVDRCIVVDDSTGQARSYTYAEQQGRQRDGAYVKLGVGALLVATGLVVVTKTTRRRRQETGTRDNDHADRLQVR